MADKALASISATALPDEIKARFAGSLNYTPGTGEKWYFKQTTVGSTSADLISTTAYMGENSGTSVASGDKIKWIAIKHTGTTNGTTKTTDGILFTHTGGTVIHSGTTSTSGVLLAPNEIAVVRLSGTTQADLNACTCTLSE